MNDDDFCIEHGYSYMRSDGGPIPYCEICAELVPLRARVTRLLVQNAELLAAVRMLVEELDDTCRRFPACHWDGVGQRWVQDENTHTIKLSLALDRIARAAIANAEKTP